MPFARALPVSIRQVGQSTARAVNQWRLVPPELLTALSRSRHFRPAEGDFESEVGVANRVRSRHDLPGAVPPRPVRAADAGGSVDRDEVSLWALLFVRMPSSSALLVFGATVVTGVAHSRGRSETAQAASRQRSPSWSRNPTPDRKPSTVSTRRLLTRHSPGAQAC